MRNRRLNFRFASWNPNRVGLWFCSLTLCVFRVEPLNSDASDQVNRHTAALRLCLQTLTRCSCSQEVAELLQRVQDAGSVEDIEKFGSVLVHRLQSARQQRNRITALEMKAVMEERDESVAKVSPV